MLYIFEIIIAAQLLSLLIAIFFVFRGRKKVKHYEAKYSKIIDLETELGKMKQSTKAELDAEVKKSKGIKDKIDTEVRLSEKAKDKIDTNIRELRASYKDKKVIFNQLVKEAAIYDELIELAELGFYKPHYDFDASEEYKENITAVKAKQKEMIADKHAVSCDAEWTVEGSKAKGRAMTNKGIRLAARAFNNECDAAIASTTWNNMWKMEQRIEKAHAAINKLNESTAIIISPEYLNLKLEELRLTNEYKDKRQQEKEEQAEIKRQMREEVKLEQELEKTIKEEDKYNKLLEKARADAEQAAGSKLDALHEKIAVLDKELAEAKAKSERAKSMAQQTKLGHVYIISNIGSFGEDVYKIGMTRRLEPLDRVKELGDASVPFIFDVHAMIYAENAPALEKQLHKSFDYKRLNLVNNRKEFFHVTLEEISTEVKKISPESEFIVTAEARQYRESKAIRLQRDEQSAKVDILDAFPDTI